MSGTRAHQRSEVLLAWWRLARPPIWLVSLVPLYVGHLFATRSIVAPSPLRLTVAMVVFGPLVWAAALYINDVHDLAADRDNPRKQQSPLVTGTLSAEAVRRAAMILAAASLVGAAWIGLRFAALTGAFLLLAWGYSVPPLRMKTRPGADIATNAIGVGVLPLLAGWAVARPLGEFPWALLPQGAAVAIGLYVPTTLVDHDADQRAGCNTVACRLGYRRAYRIGAAAWGTAIAGAAALAALDVALPRAMLPWLVAGAPVLAVAYHVLIGRARSPAEVIRGIVVISALFLVPVAGFALLYAR
jgi:chlorophyll synthase